MKIRRNRPARAEVAYCDTCSTVCDGSCRANAVLDRARTAGLAARL
jgi:hypothetical protein